MKEKKKNLDSTEDMSMTFISDVNQKSAVAEDTLSDVSGFPDIKVNPPSDREKESEKKDRNHNRKGNQKGKWWLITIFLMTLSLIIGFFGASFLYEREKENKTKIEEKEVKEKTIEEESLLLKRLISRYDYLYNPKITYDALYQNEKTQIQKIDKDYLRALVSLNATKDFAHLTFTDLDFQNALATLFGNQITLEEKEVEMDEKHFQINYDKEKQVYSMKLNDISENKIEIQKKIMKATKRDDTLEIEVAIALVDKWANKVYREYLDDNLSEQIEDKNAQEFSIESDYHNLNQYRYTFEYDDDNQNYFLNTIELVK